MAATAGAAQTTVETAVRTVPRRLHAVHLTLGGDPGVAFAKARAAGFSHALVAPPWLAGARGNPYLTRDFDALDPRLGCRDLSDLVAKAGRAGVGLLLDVVLDRVSSQAELAGVPDSPFAVPERDILLDPRRSEGADAALARLAGRGDVLALAAWWAAKLASWQANGVAGFRLLGLDAIEPVRLAAFAGALRAATMGSMLLAWTPGVTREAVRALKGVGLDGVFSSSPWWDWQADFLWAETAELTEVAPLFGVDGVPPDLRNARRPGLARDVSLAAILGQGWLHVAPADGPAAGLAALASALDGQPALTERTPVALPLGDSGPVIALLRSDAADHRSASHAVLAVINGDAARTLDVHGAALLVRTGGVFGPFRDVLDPSGSGLVPDTSLRLAPGELRLFTADAHPVDAVRNRASARTAQEAAGMPRLAIERPTPCVDGGSFPVKAVTGELIGVEADIVFDGHEKIAAALSWRGPDGVWHETPMRPLGNDRWQAAFPLLVLGRHDYVVTAWRDRFETFRDELAKKAAAGVPIRLELLEGQALVEAAASRSQGEAQGRLRSLLKSVSAGDEADRLAAFLAPATSELMAVADDRPFLVRTAPIPVDAERIEARFASWYEVFPRSMSDDPARHGTFSDVERHLPRIAGMGFDVLYFPPISPIGRTNRKGRNNTLTPAADDPGSPYAIGSEAGGHDALHPQLGTLADFQHLREAAARHGLELAIDFAIQCSPDHPWLKQHPGWFDYRPDGTIRYAENPPKKYEDIVNVDFYAKEAVPDLWVALCDVVLFWADQGIRLFRVDNPHTKPLPFWQWMIGTVRARYPDAVFLAEAFTRPKVMYRLAKIGFSQSYTYFTWRNSKRELEEYLTELDSEAPRDFFRPHFFVNTPDINPPFLQNSGRPGFLIRAALAATLSGLWGVYNGFELCEAAAIPGKEEYLDSEKYQIRAWDWDRPGNIVDEITVLNRIRRRNPALQTHLGVTFLTAHNDTIMFYEKATPDRSNAVLIAVSLDPGQAQEADIEVPLWRWKLPDDASLPMQDLIGGEHFTWHGKFQHVRLTPQQPYAIWRVRSL